MRIKQIDNETYKLYDLLKRIIQIGTVNIDDFLK